MCCGMGCPFEACDGGCGRGSALCPEEAYRDRAAAGRAAGTELHCPDCGSGGQRACLRRDGRGDYLCPTCGVCHTPEQLRDAYQAEYDDLMADAAWTRTRLELVGRAAA